MAAERRTIVCDVQHLVAPDAACVDALCRLQLEARRRGCVVELRNRPRALVELLNFMGVADVLRGSDEVAGDAVPDAG